MSTKIEWTEETWNPTVGCSKVSDGCKNCYAIRMANRLAHIPAMADLYMDTVTVGANGQPNWTGVVKLNMKALSKPTDVNKPTVWFVDSMSDLFHEALSFTNIRNVFLVMQFCPQHTFQILTKRPERMKQYFEMFPLDAAMPNVWLGVSVENQKAADERVPILCSIPAVVRFLSCEPLLGPVNITKWLIPTDDIGAIHWVICGGESGPGSRPMQYDWAIALRDQCLYTGARFFFKQWGDWAPANKVTTEMKRVGKAKAGRLLDGREWNERPNILR